MNYREAIQQMYDDVTKQLKSKKKLHENLENDLLDGNDEVEGRVYSLEKEITVLNRSRTLLNDGLSSNELKQIQSEKIVGNYGESITEVTYSIGNTGKCVARAITSGGIQYEYYKITFNDAVENNSSNPLVEAEFGYENGEQTVYGIQTAIKTSEYMRKYLAYDRVQPIEWKNDYPVEKRNPDMDCITRRVYDVQDGLTVTYDSAIFDSLDNKIGKYHSSKTLGATDVKGRPIKNESVIERSFQTSSGSSHVYRSEIHNDRYREDFVDGEMVREIVASNGNEFSVRDYQDGEKKRKTLYRLEGETAYKQSEEHFEVYGVSQDEAMPDEIPVINLCDMSVGSYMYNETISPLFDQRFFFEYLDMPDELRACMQQESVKASRFNERGPAEVLDDSIVNALKERKKKEKEQETDKEEI